MRSAITISLKVFFVLFFLVVSATAQSTQTVDNTQSWTESSWDNIVEVEGIAQQTNQLKPNNHTIRCSQYNFDLFFMLFSEDRYFQESAIIFPVKATILSPKDVVTQEESYNSEYFTTRHIFWVKQKEGVGVNIFPNRQQRTADNLDYSVETDSPRSGMNTVVLRKEGTGINYRFIFIWKGCWFLSEFENNST